MSRLVPDDSYYYPEDVKPPKGMVCRDCANCSESPAHDSDYGYCKATDEWTLLTQKVCELDCPWSL